MLSVSRKYLSTLSILCSSTLEGQRVNRHLSTPYSRVKTPVRDKNRKNCHHKKSDQLRTRYKQPLSTSKLIPYDAKEETSGIRKDDHKQDDVDTPSKICKQKRVWTSETAKITTSELGNIPNFDILDDCGTLTTTSNGERFSYRPKCFHTRRDRIVSIGNTNVATQKKRKYSRVNCDKQIQLKIVEKHDNHTIGGSNDGNASSLNAPSLAHESIEVNDVENDITYNEDDLHFLRSFGDTIPSCDGDDDARENDDFDTLFARPLQRETQYLNGPDFNCNEESLENGVLNDFTAIQYLVEEDAVEKHFNPEFRNTVTDILPDDKIVTNPEQTKNDIGDIENEKNSIEAYMSDAESTDGFKINLDEAVQESVASQSMTPIVKQELQLKLQLNRLERGEDELKLEPEAPPIYKLTDVEIRKNNDRREQNRLSAVKCRRKSRDQERVLSQKLDNASTVNRILSDEKKELIALKEQLLCELTAHFEKCPRLQLVATQMKRLASLP